MLLFLFELISGLSFPGLDFFSKSFSFFTFGNLRELWLFLRSSARAGGRSLFFQPDLKLNSDDAGDLKLNYFCRVQIFLSDAAWIITENYKCHVTSNLVMRRSKEGAATIGKN